MNMKQAAALLGLFVLGVLGASVLKKQKTAPIILDQYEGWQQYSDSKLRFKYPPDWAVKYFTQKKVQDDHWLITHPDSMKNENGNMHLIRYPDGAETRPLDKIFDIKKWSSSVLVSTPKKLDLKGGQCMTYALENTSIRKGALALIEVNCYSHKKDFFYMEVDLDRYETPGRPTDEGRKNARIVEQVLSSLEFL
ncbi:MAG TPA: hypothetical protein DCM05_11345 [Elusimicrobia bacterium]|nr:hypothetical protein [Elusimicrobiota bacterium]